MKYFLAVVILFTCTQAQAQSSNLAGFPFLRLEPSARAAALAGSFSAVYGDDVSALFYNPALINETMNGALAASYINHLSDLKAGSVAYARDIGKLGTVGFGLRYLGYGSFERADETGLRDGTTFGAGDAALTVGLARSYGERLRYGVNLHALWSRIDDFSTNALAADAGLLFMVPSQLLTFSASVHHVGFVLHSFGDVADALPLDLRIGVAKRLTHLPLMVSVTGYDLNNFGGPGGFGDDVLQHLAIGTEFLFSEAFNIRLGYNHRRHEALKTDSRLDLAGVGLGFGLKITRFRLDYAYNSWSALGGLHQVTVRTVL